MDRHICLIGALLLANAGCGRPATVINETPPDVAAVEGSVIAISGGPVIGATLRIDAFRTSGGSTQLIDHFSAQTDTEGRFVRVLILGAFGLQQCQVIITVTPPVGSGLLVKTDTVIARVGMLLPPADTARVDFILTP